MPRRKPASAKQRKAELQFKRAVQRGDVEAPPKQHPSSRRKRPGERSALPSSGSGVTTKKLESRFLKLDKDWLEHARLVASTTALPRPIPIEATILDLKAIAAVEDGPMPVLTAPRRPKWRYDQSKKEVEKNEEGIFTKWIKETDTAIKNWQKPAIVPEKETGKTDDAAERQWERSPTYFERNIEVWRQLWRVTEISQILLVLLDSRAPTIHYPGSLQSYLQALRPAPQIIFVLTKIDLVGASRARAWTEYLLSQNPGSQVILAESYEERNVLNDGRGAKKFLDPHIPPELLSRLIEALQTAHERLLTPPPEIASDEKRLKNWKPKIKESVNWKAACETYNIPASGEPSGSIGEDVEGDIDAPYVTVGLIGQPNVGKSSLLNALFGARKVRASKTPGKTKHFQTLFWTPEIRCVDCPGLVFPGLVPMEMQVLAGILPISQVSSIASCIQFACQRMPLERILELNHPEAEDKDKEDKRTWRTGMERSTDSPGVAHWTAMDVMTAYAKRKGWLTAKSGRPDVNRGGNAILRFCADGRNIQWGFWPPGMEDKSVAPGSETEGGIWIRGVRQQWEDAASEDEDEDEDDEADSEERHTGEEDEADGSQAAAEAGESGDESEAVHIAGGRFGFGALQAALSGDESDE